MTNALVIISGSAYSLLYYETATCGLAQEGFLLGSIDEETSEVTQNDGKEVVRIIRVNNILPCPLLGYFYNNVGGIHSEKLANFLGFQISNVVGWYRFNKHQIFDPTLRERHIHSGLARAFCISVDQFPLCILMNSLQEGDSAEDVDTIASLFKVKFMVREGVRWSIAKINILNLDDKDSNKRRGYTTQTFQSLVRNLRLSPAMSQGVPYTTNLHQDVCEHLLRLCEELANEEEKLFDLGSRVKELLSARRFSRSQTSLVSFEALGDFGAEMEIE